MEPTTGKNEVGQVVSAFDAPDLSPEEMTEHAAGVIATALEATGLVEIRETQANMVNQVHLLCRVKEENARAVAHKMVFSILRSLAHDEQVEAFLGKQFLLKSDKLAYAWVFSFAGEDLNHMMHIVCDAIELAIPRKKVDVLEAPLMGPGTPQSVGPGSRGAAKIR
jgi:hypothetical protein